MWFDAGLTSHRSYDVRVVVTHLCERKTEHLDRVVLLAVTSKLFSRVEKNAREPVGDNNTLRICEKNGNRC